MSDSLVIFGWAALGLCVSFVAMILPFRRGVSGVAINIVVAVGAAMAGGLLGRAIGLYDRLSAPLSFGFAVAVSLLVSILMHVVVLRRSRGHESSAE